MHEAPWATASARGYSYQGFLCSFYNMRVSVFFAWSVLSAFTLQVRACSGASGSAGEALPSLRGYSCGQGCGDEKDDKKDKTKTKESKLEMPAASQLEARRVLRM